SFSYSSSLTQLSWLQLRLLPVRFDKYWTALRSQNADKLTDGPITTSIYNPSWADSEPVAINNQQCIAIELSPLSTLTRGWQFIDCSSPLPVICQTFACVYGQFRCFDNTRCIPGSAVNDGFEDCVDGSDENGSVKNMNAISFNASRSLKLLASAPGDTTEASSTLVMGSVPSTVTVPINRVKFDCYLPMALQNVLVEYPTGYSLDSKILWTCNAGFAPRGQQQSVCTTQFGWSPSIQCNALVCYTPDPVNLYYCVGTAPYFHGDRCYYRTKWSNMNREYYRVAVCDNGDWVYMNNELDSSLIVRNSGRQLGNISTSMDNDVTFTSTELCYAEGDSCSRGQVCKKDSGTSAYFCVCPAGQCMYPMDVGCSDVAVLPDGQYSAVDGECATIRCPISALNETIPLNCRVTSVDESKGQEQLRLGSTDVICERTSNGEQVQERYSVKCLEGGQWENVQFNKPCMPIRGLTFDTGSYGFYDIATITYPQFPRVPMTIRCGGDGKWLGEVPVTECLNGRLKQEYNLVRCFCDTGYFGDDCSSPCYHGTVKIDGTCQCDAGFTGDNCDMETCSGTTANFASDGEQIMMVFIIDL
ncbi:hypothetical protein PFISCL1PPCAC_9778, partial [Pristionchus fissidentatus]